MRPRAETASFLSRTEGERAMAEQKESSVLFSLKELMNLEEDRIKQEENERRRVEEAAVQARLAEERRAREAEESRLRAAEEERRQNEQRSREEQARLDAIRHAEIEKARLEAENAARMEQLRRQQEHEQKIHALSQDQGKKKLLWIAIGSGVVLFIALIGGGVAIKNSMDRQKALETQLNDLNSANSELQGKLASATTPEERARLEAEIAANQQAMKDLKDHPSTAPTVAPKPVVHAAPKQNTGGTPSKPCNCTPGDPLCSCL